MENISRSRKRLLNWFLINSGLLSYLILTGIFKIKFNSFTAIIMYIITFLILVLISYILSRIFPEKLLRLKSSPNIIGISILIILTILQIVHLNS